MKTVGVKELKDRLSTYLKLVKNGDTVLVTERNHIIAEIRQPVPADNVQDTRLEEYLAAEERKGGIVRAKRKISIIDSFVKKGRKKKPLINWKESYMEVRSDRF